MKLNGHSRGFLYYVHIIMEALKSMKNKYISDAQPEIKQKQNKHTHQNHSWMPITHNP